MALPGAAGVDEPDPPPDCANAGEASSDPPNRSRETAIRGEIDIAMANTGAGAMFRPGVADVHDIRSGRLVHWHAE